MTWYHYSGSGTKTKVGELEDAARLVGMSITGTDQDEEIIDVFRNWLLDRYDVVDLVKDLTAGGEDEDFDDLVLQFAYDTLVKGDGLNGFRQEAEE